MAKYAKIDSGGSDSKDETPKRLSAKSLNKSLSYLIPNVKKSFTSLRQAFTRALIL